MRKEKPAAETIEGWRRRIDELNDDILKLLSERAWCALEIGRLKHASGQPIHVPEREVAVLEHLRKTNTGPLTGDAVVRLFRAIMEEMRRLEQEDTQPPLSNGGPPAGM